VKITPHTLRHSAITYLSESGADVPTIKEFSGHRSLEMVMRLSDVSAYGTN
jgi:integrase